MMDRETRHAGINLSEATPEASQRAETALFGFWVFLMSDAVIFALLFATYGVMLGGTAGGPGPAALFDLASAGIETALLLLSSFTFGMASLALKYDADHRHLRRWLLVTLVLGTAFLALELRDIVLMIGQGAGPSRSGYLSSFFALVPMHGMHVLAGCIWIAVMLVQVGRLGVTTLVQTRILRLGLFWHFLDIIWIGIFTLVYLQGLLP